VSNPKVSVLLATYNAMPFLPAAVESMLAQTFSDFELVLVDDGSTDDSADYLKSLADPRIVYIRQDNAGLAAALNHGIQHCRGEYIARMDGDDISLPERLAEQVAFLDSHEDIGCVGTQTAPFGNARVGGDLRLPTTHDEIYQAISTGAHGIVHASVMMRTQLVRDVGGYWPFRLVAEDFDFFLRLGEITQLATIDRVLYHTRFHMASINGRGMLQMRRSVDYACDRARRRRDRLGEISFDEFINTRAESSWWQRSVETVDAYARSQYRASVAEFCGGRPIVGYSRLAWAALCAPTLTMKRIFRTLRPASR
jgi:glycosyltransferase involved in cell wall biosynthesis